MGARYAAECEPEQRAHKGTIIGVWGGDRMKTVGKLVERWMSLLMAAGLGYVLLSSLDRTAALAAAWAVVFLGAMVKLALFAGAKRARTPV